MKIYKTLFQETDKKYFYETYHWLITSSTMNITEKLKILRLNINSDMNLVIFKQSDSINNANVSIYDVYNPAFEHGGELKVDIFGYYNQKQGYIINNLENKYWRRKNMTGVTFKSAVVVRNYLDFISY